MKRLAIVVLGAVGFGSLAGAADMPIKAPVVAKAPAGYSAVDWSGFYLGAHAGYGWSEFRGTYDDGGDTGDMRFPVNGGLAGGQIGYNWQFGRFVYGIEADATWANLKGSRIDSENDRQEFKTDFLASLRGRAGAAIDNTLLYGTFGLAYARSKFTVTGDVPSPAEVRLNSWGYVSGLGLEWAFAPNWSVRGEYLYYWFNKRNDLPTLTNDSEPTDYIRLDGVHVARAAINYRFGGGGGRQVAPVMNWAGLYAGVHLGYGRSRMTGDYDDAGDNGSFDVDPRGVIAGGQIGYNWQSGAWVYGVEADATWGGMKKSRIDTENDSQELKTDLLASFRGRVGVAAGDKLVYITGGAGYASSKLNVSESIGPTVASVRLNTWGGVVGAGTEWAFAPNWSARLEGLTYLFDKRIGLANLTPDSDTTDALRQSTVNVIRLGVNYRFTPSVVSARY